MKTIITQISIFIFLFSSQKIIAQWDYIGTDSGKVSTETSFFNLALSSTDVPYAVFRDEDNGGKLSVKKYNDSGDSWDIVGTAGFSDDTVSFCDIKLASDDTPYVAYTDNNSSAKVTVKKYNGTTWETVGTEGFSDGAANFTTLIITSDDNLYVAYADDGNGEKITVKTYNTTTENWDDLGSAGFSVGPSYHLNAAIDSSDNIYLTFIDNGLGDYATVMTYNSTTEAWENVGDAEVSDVAGVTYPDIAIDSNDIVYIGYAGDGGNVKEYSSDDAKWKDVGDPGFLPSDLLPDSSSITLLIDSNDSIIFLYDSGDEDTIELFYYISSTWFRDTEDAGFTETIIGDGVKALIGENDLVYNLFVGDAKPEGNLTVMSYQPSTLNISEQSMSSLVITSSNGTIQANLDVNLKIYNVLGQQLENKNLSSGLYMVKAENKKTGLIKTIKIITSESK